MSSFLRRSKSSRDPRRQALSRDQQQQQEQFQFPFPPLAEHTATTKADLPLRTFTTASRRNPYITGISSTTITATQEATPPSGTANLLRLVRRKSISSVRESVMALGFSDTWRPPATANPISAAEMKKRTSIFFGLASPAAPPRPSTPPHPKRAAPPPPIRLSAFPFPPRQSSRTPTPSIGDDAGEDTGPIGMALGSPSVGMALGSPSEVKRPFGENPSAFQSMELLSQVQPGRDSPAFLLPPEPFGVTAPERPQSSRKREPAIQPQPEEPPKTAGWRRMFGKGLFGKRSNVKSRGAAPELPPPTHTASVLSRINKSGGKAGKPVAKTPCLDVDIPCVEMERYSIMFGSLLPPSEKSSLFARRRSSAMVSGISFGSSTEDLNKQDALSILTSNSSQAGVPRLEINPLKRNATTGSHLLPRSPLSRLGDDLRRLSSESRRSGSTLTPLPSPSLSSPGLGRSNTTAADGRLSPIPPQAGFTRQGMLSPLPPPPLAHYHREKTFYFTSPTPDDRPSSSVSRISEESSIDTPPGSFDEGDDQWMTRNGDDDEPQWEMVTKDSSSVHTPQHHHNGSLPKDEEDELVTAAQISIARQISVSQRQLLTPVIPRYQRLISRGSVKDPLKPRLVEHRLSSMPAAVKKPAEKAAVETV